MEQLPPTVIDPASAAPGAVPLRRHPRSMPWAIVKVAALPGVRVRALTLAELQDAASAAASGDLSDEDAALGRAVVAAVERACLLPARLRSALTRTEMVEIFGASWMLSVGVHGEAACKAAVARGGAR